MNYYLKYNDERTCIMDFSKYGSKEALIKFAKIVGYYALSGAIVSLASALKGYTPSNDDIIAVVLVMIANATISAISKWVTTKKP